jgi:hypothetical protein
MSQVSSHTPSVVDHSLQTAQDHAAQIIKLRAAKEQADAKQATMQKEMKEEIERLRTQFTFKVRCSR